MMAKDCARRERSKQLVHNIIQYMMANHKVEESVFRAFLEEIKTEDIGDLTDAKVQSIIARCNQNLTGYNMRIRVDTNLTDNKNYYVFLAPPPLF